MKKLLLLIIVVVGGIYGIGMINLSESSANSFLNKLEDLSLRGKGEEYCDRLHDKLEVSVDDRTGDQPVIISGGKQEFCEHVKMASKGMELLNVSTNVTRNDFTVERSWMHPWTARVSYNEDRTTTLSAVNVTLRTQSDDRMTLVYTFGGLKILRLESTATQVQ